MIVIIYLRVNIWGKKANVQNINNLKICKNSQIFVELLKSRSGKNSSLEYHRRPSFFGDPPGLHIGDPQIFLGDLKVFIRDTRIIFWKPPDFPLRPKIFSETSDVTVIFIGKPQISLESKMSPMKSGGKYGVCDEMLWVSNEIRGSPMISFGSQKKIRGLQRKSVVSDAMLGVSNENLWVSYEMTVEVSNERGSPIVFQW